MRAPCLCSLALLSGCTVLFAPPEARQETDGGGRSEDGGGAPPREVVRVTTDSGASAAPSLVASPDGFSIAWQDDREEQDEIFAVRLSAAGEKLGGDVRVTFHGGASERPVAMARDGGYGIVWQDRYAGFYEVYFATLDADGTKKDELRMTNDQSSYSIAPSGLWTGSALAFAWSDGRDGNSEIYFARSDGESAPESVHRLTEETSSSREPALAWSGSDFALVWQDGRVGEDALFFGRIEDGATSFTDAAEITEGLSAAQNPALVATGADFALAWQQDVDGDGNDEIYLVRLDAAGNELGGRLQVAAPSGGAAAPSLAWTGSQLGVAWEDRRHGSGEIYLARVSDEGDLMEELRVTDDEAASRTPSLAARDDTLAVAWQDHRDGNPEIYFALIAP